MTYKQAIAHLIKEKLVKSEKAGISYPLLAQWKRGDDEIMLNGYFTLQDIQAISVFMEGAP